jgi:hypothetical protein
LAKNGSGYVLGEFFTNSFGHTECKLHLGNFGPPPFLAGLHKLNFETISTGKLDSEQGHRKLNFNRKVRFRARPSKAQFQPESKIPSRAIESSISTGKLDPEQGHRKLNFNRKVRFQARPSKAQFQPESKIPSRVIGSSISTGKLDSELRRRKLPSTESLHIQPAPV